MREREFSLTTKIDNPYLVCEGVVEALIDDVNGLLHYLSEYITGEVDGDSHILLEPYKLGLEAAVNEADKILTESDIVIMRGHIGTLFGVILEGLQDRSKWFTYTYRLTGTVENKLFGTHSIYLKRYDKILDISNDEYSSVERRISILVNRLIQIT